MGNTIRSPRRRLRVRSLNWRSLWWLIKWEASYQLYCRHESAPWPRPAWFTAVNLVGDERAYWFRRWALHPPVWRVIP